MGLDKQLINYPFSKGLDTKTDPKQVQPTSLILIQNGTYQTLDEIRKRNGYSKIGSQLSAHVGNALTAFKNTLIGLDGQSLFAYSPAETAMVSVGTKQAVDVSVTGVAGGSGNLYYPSSAVNGNYICNVWNDAIKGSVYEVIDQTTQSPVVSPTVLDSNVAVVPVVRTLGAFFIILQKSAAGNLVYFSINTATPTSISGSTTVGAAMSGVQFAAEVINSSLFMSWGTGGNTGHLRALTSALSLGTAKVITYQDWWAIAGDASNNVWVFGAKNAALTLTYEIYSFNLVTTVLANAQIDTYPDISGYGDGFLSPRNITAVVSGTTATVYYDKILGEPIYLPTQAFAGTIDGYGYISKNTATLTGTVGAPASFARGVLLGSTYFQYASSTYIIGIHVSALQSSYFVFNSSGIVVSKWGYGLAPSDLTFSTLHLGKAVALTASSFMMSYSVVLGVTSESPLTYLSTLSVPEDHIVPSSLEGLPTNYQSGVNSISISFGGAIQKTIAGNSAVMSNSVPSIFDGVSAVEQGFLLYPESVSSAGGPNANNPGGIGTGSGTATVFMGYACTYAWRDAQGQIHRSAPSPVCSMPVPYQPKTFTGDVGAGGVSNRITVVSDLTWATTGATISGTGIPTGTHITSVDSINNYVYMDASSTAANNGVTVTVHDTASTLMQIPTLRLTQRKNVWIDIWRTVGNGTVFYQVTNPLSPLLNDTTVDFVQHQDAVPDSILISNNQLYTNGGEVPNICAPPASNVGIFKDRVFLITEEDPLTLWYSKEILPGVPVEFSDEFTIRVVEEGGGLIAHAQMDDKNILFKANTILYMAGDGPSPNGTNNDFTAPQVITTDTGCINPRSVVLMPRGLMYQSNNGIYLLDRSLQVSYIGAPVEAYNSASITSANLVPGTTQVRFTLSTGIALVYDYLVSQWSIFQNVAASDACIFNGLYTFLDTAGNVQQETIGVFNDNAAFIPLGLTTAWLKFSGIQGYQLVYNMLILGEWKSAHTLTAQFLYDFDSTPSQAAIPMTVSSSLVPYQLRVFPQRTRCEALQVILTETQAGAPYGEGLSLSGLAFEFGLKKGLYKIPAAQSYG